MRTATINRATAETDIALTLNLDGTGQHTIDTGVGFLNHMLELFSCHGRFDLQVTCKGDTQVDDHHSVEDIGICLGMAFAEALGDCKGIVRYGSMALAMDEACMLCVVDISGRGGFYPDFKIPAEKVGTFDTELCEEFWHAFCRTSGITNHIKELEGKNAHHMIEAIFKCQARVLRNAVTIDPRLNDEIPSSKGTL